MRSDIPATTGRVNANRGPLRLRSDENRVGLVPQIRRVALPRPVTIALVWHQMNSDNLGVGALTVANIAILRQAARAAGREPRFLVAGWRDARAWYETSADVEDHCFRTRHLPSPTGPLQAALARADIVFDIGGGDSFTDIYGPKRFLTVWGAKFRTILAGKPLVLSPQTIGPFERAWTRTLARRVMDRAAAVVTRDAPSTAFLADLGVRTEMLEATDVAMRLPYAPAPRDAGGPVRVGLNVSGLLMNGGYTGKNQFGLAVDYPALVRQIIEWVMAQDGTELHLIGHVQSESQPVEDDQRASEAFAREFPGAILGPRFGSPSEAKGYISGMDFFMGARMHATIAAFSSGVPVIPMAYSRKFKGVFETLGYAHVADCRSDTAEGILNRIKEGYRDRAALAEEVTVAMKGVDSRLDAYAALATRLISAA